ncbi:MAG: T9SS type A sorting domain-containing protein [Saprospiraceae bacterium]|nr:T9SS type A sorting domain-containing protein [Saprospiraceae bacterium]
MCIELLERICPTADSIQVTNLTPASATLRWTSIMDGIAYLYRYKKKGSSMWMDKADTTQSFSISGLNECTEYEFQVKTICAFDTSAYTSTLVFKTTGAGCPVSVITILPDDIVSVYPNPFSDRLDIQFRQDPFDGQDFRLKCINVHGQLIFSKSMKSSSSRQNSTINIGTEFELQNQGVYFLIIESQDKRILKKLIKY